jgi:glycosyltransferase involved in cell wall biosynthesis
MFGGLPRQGRGVMMRLLGLAQADPSVPTTGSGATAKYLLDALARRHRLVGRRAVDLTALERYPLAAASFHPSRERWRARYFWGGRVALGLRSLNSWHAVRSVDEPFDLVVQLFGLFRTHGAPYVVYTDNTVRLSRLHWPEWVAVEGRALERLYAWERRLFGEARQVFTMGRPAAESISSFYGVPEERVTAVGGGVAFDSWPEPSTRAREPLVLYVGRDWRRKGGDLLVEAFRRLRAARPDARLAIVGTDEPTAEPGVEVLGRVADRDALADLYARASVYCLPSRFEPYGLSVLEAMAHELPCVVAGVGALRDIVADGETGLVVNPDDSAGLAAALHRLLDDPGYARTLGVAGRARVESEHTWDAVVERMASGLERAAGRRSTRFSRAASPSAERSASAS